MTDWQPIETAPKDGTVILVFQPPRAGQKGSFDDFSLVKWSSWGNGACGAWTLAETGGYAEDDTPMNDAPTHWMPLVRPND